MAHRVFVYGTLKRGFPNFRRAGMERAEFLGEVRTRLPHPLVSDARYRLPCLLLEPGEGLSVKGELFGVDAALLAALDRFEGVDLPDLYRREEIEVTQIGDAAAAETALVWTYVRSRAHLRRPISEPMEEYRMPFGYGPPPWVKE